MTASLPPTVEHPPIMAARQNGAGRPEHRRRSRRWLLIAAVLLLLAGGLGLRLATAGPPPEPPAMPTATAPKLTARGRVQPAAQARIGTLAGGVVMRLAVAAGDQVVEGQEVARVRGAGGAPDVLTAPWSGTITSVPVNLGDTVTPGATVATLGDLSRLRVETTDVDEFLIGRVRPGGRVTILVDALDRRELPGYVATVALQAQTTTAGDDYYPVVIDLLEPAADLRPGMSVRVTFHE